MSSTEKNERLQVKWDNQPLQEDLLVERKKSNTSQSTKEKSKTTSKKVSEIPKLKILPKPRSLKGGNTEIHSSDKNGILKSQCNTKDADNKKLENNQLNCVRAGKDMKQDDKIKEAIKEDFDFLIPLYESEFEKISKVWTNTLYSSLTLRSNLVKFLFQQLPHINKSQFETENEKLLEFIAHTKSYSKTEAENLIQFIKFVQGNREKVKEQYIQGMANKDVAQVYNYDWRSLIKKIAEVTEETKKLQIGTNGLERKKETSEATKKEKVKDMEASIANKDAQIQKIKCYLKDLKEKNQNYKQINLETQQHFKTIKAEMVQLQSMEKEYEEFKRKFLTQNEEYEKKIKDLKYLLEEKNQILNKEKEVKERVGFFLENLKAFSEENEKLNFVLSMPSLIKEKQREQLWIAAVKLVLRGWYKI